MKADSTFTEDIIFTDICSKSNKKIHYMKFKDELNTVKVETTNITPWRLSQYFYALIKDIFLPRGYPNSVSSDYLEYQIWDTCQAFCSSISGTLTIRAVMQGIGVGSETATPVSAAVTWILKDGTGMIGSILFAWLKGSKLDSDCKKWRLFADVLNDIAMFIELYIPYVIDYSMSMLCVATAFKALVGTAGSSTRAALITHQAITENIADVTAKDGSQEIFTNLCAFLFGIILLKEVTDTDQIWTIMCTTTMFHLIFNYKAVRCLKMDIFNAERFRLGLRIYLPTSSIPTIEQINQRESVFLMFGTSDYELCGFSIKFGRSLKKAVVSQELTVNQLQIITKFFQDKKYLILVHTKKKKLYIAFREIFSENDALKAYFHALLLGIAINFLQSNSKLSITSRSRKNSPLYRLRNILREFLALKSSDEDQEETLILKAYMICEDFIDKEFVAFCNACVEEGWKINKHLFVIDDWRADWEYVEEKEAKVIHSKKLMRKSSARPEKVQKSRNLAMNLVIS